ncbi:MAG TPA: hypothetical protein VME70_00765 [Mycobacteriales bacterium]|nr:hypothetical protein [Mycobacteriales bacterium]
MATQSVATQGSRSTERATIRAKTLRTDRWWIDPAITFVVFTAFVIYATWAAFNHPLVYGHGAPHRIFYAKPYLSPLYSPCVAHGCPSDVAWWHWDAWQWLSPALYILIFPLGFRATCYYYRRAYYRSYWLSPPACAVAEPHKRYSGETRFPLILQNVHRYFWYATLVFAGILTYDVVLAFIYKGHFFLGVGTAVMLINVVLIWGYQLGCHSCRHITAGRLNHFSKHPIRYKWWTFVSKLNHWHRHWAWASLISIACTDLYIRLVANGTITDYHHVF